MLKNLLGAVKARGAQYKCVHPRYAVSATTMKSYGEKRLIVTEEALLPEMIMDSSLITVIGSNSSIPIAVLDASF